MTPVGIIPGSDLFAGKQLERIRPGGSLYRCRGCHLMFRSPRPDEDDLRALYSAGSDLAWISRADDRADWTTAVSWIRKRLPIGARILDVGCFDGSFLELLGPQYGRFGIEIQPSAREKARARGLEIVASGYHDLDKIANRFDGIVSFDLIEHVHDPLMFLSILTRALRSPGIIIVSSANSDATTWRLMGARYWYCAISEHISFISPRWSQAAAEKVGLTLENIAFFSHVRASLPQKCSELVKNLLYRASPASVRLLRRKGVGRKNTNRFESLGEYPPSWMSARDHFIFLGSTVSSE